jgi:vancomycin permeability regulator SanA
MNALDRMVERLLDLINKRVEIHGYPEKFADCTLVLGRGIHGGTMTLAQKANIEKAILLHKIGKTGRLLLSGGWTENKTHPGNFTEAGVMKEAALEMGIGEDIVHTDTSSMDTEASILYLKEMSGRLGCESSIVVADFTHYTRTKWLVKRLGVNNCEVIVSYWDPQQGDLGMSFSMLMLRELLAFITAATLPKSTIAKIRRMLRI